MFPPPPPYVDTGFSWETRVDEKQHEIGCDSAKIGYRMSKINCTFVQISLEILKRFHKAWKNSGRALESKARPNAEIPESLWLVSEIEIRAYGTGEKIQDIRLGVGLRSAGACCRNCFHAVADSDVGIDCEFLDLILALG